jgi:diguanylate cyclase
MLTFPSAAHPRVQSLRHALYGSDPLCREHISRLMRTFWLTVVAGVLLGVGSHLGLTPWWATALIVGYSSLIAGGLYALMRSGVARRWSVPGMTYAQLLLSISAVVVSYGAADIARGAALQLLCLLLAFEMDRLSQRQLITASLFALVMLGLISTARVLLLPGQVHLALEVYDLIMAAFLLPLAIVVGAEVGRSHNRLLRQRELLASTLTQLNALSTRDALTGLANRRHAMSLLEQEQKRQQRGGAGFFVALLDIDWFKRINDSHGHGVGDKVLHRFAKLCADKLSTGDTLARWGGEEFLLLMPACDVARAQAVMGQLRQAVAAEPWPALAEGLRLSFSAGVAAHASGQGVAQTLERADRALYNAKDMGRDRTVTAAMAAADVPLDAPAARASPAVPAPDETAPDETAFAAVGPSAWVADMATSTMPRMARMPVATPAFSPVEGDITLFESAGETTPALPRWRAGWQRLCAALGRLVMGRDAAVREHLRLPLMAVPAHLFWMAAVLWFAIPTQHIGHALGYTVVAYELACVLVFYGLIRSGITAQWRDPSLVLAQMLAALAVAACGYVVAPTLRASLLHLICVVLVFGMVSLRPAASRLAGAVSVGLLLSAMVGILWLQPGPHAAEVLKLVLACFVMGRLSMLSQNFSQVRRYVAVEQKQLSRAVAQVQELVIRDGLTGLFNRKHMQDLLAREHDRFARTGQIYSVAVIDVDHFKKVNDVHGHQVGDEVLCGLASAAQSCLRQTDVIARWGGEEFLVLMPDTDPRTQGLAALARLRHAVSTLQFPGATTALTVRFSAGLGAVQAGESIEQLIERADRALYMAKGNGRNRDELAELPRSAAAGHAPRAVAPVLAA